MYLLRATAIEIQRIVLNFDVSDVVPAVSEQRLFY